MRDECKITRNLLDRQDRVLRKAAERGITLADLELETGISKHTLASYQRTNSREPSVMPLTAFIKLVIALPDDLANNLIQDTGYILKPAEAKQKDWLSFAERTAEFSAKVLRYQSTDGRIDHAEDADLTEEAKVLAADAEAMVRA